MTFVSNVFADRTSDGMGMPIALNHLSTGSPTLEQTSRGLDMFSEHTTRQLWQSVEHACQELEDAASEDMEDALDGGRDGWMRSLQMEALVVSSQNDLK